MVEHLGRVVRSLRESAEVSLEALATGTHYTKSAVCNIEAGRKPVSAEFLANCDRVLGTTPLLSLLGQFGEGDSVKRRAFVHLAGLVGFSGGSALAEVVRQGLLDTTGGHEDWDAAIAEFERGLIVAPTQRLGESLLAQLTLAQQQIRERGKNMERLRAAARLVQLYGLWLGNQGHTPLAHGWHRTAIDLARQSQDRVTQAHVQGRSLSRGCYEGASARDTLSGLHEVLGLGTGPCAGLLESYSALVHVHALTGNLASGREAVTNMIRTAEALPDPGSSVGSMTRALHFKSYLNCRIAPFGDAEQAYNDVAPLLRAAPVWDVDAKIYFGRALVGAGDVTAGIQFALDAVESLPADVDVQIINIGVQDLLSIVPRQYTRTDELDALKAHSATGPAPWDTI